MSKGFFILRYRHRDRHWAVETFGGQIVSTHRQMLEGMRALKRWQQGRVNAIQIETTTDAQRAFERERRKHALYVLRLGREKPR